MGKVGQWLLQMQEDAAEMTAEEFIKKHGKHNVDIWVKEQWQFGDGDNIEEQYLAAVKPVGSA